MDGSYFFFFALKCQSLHGQLPNFDIFPPKTQRLFIQPSIPQTEKHSPDWAEIAAEKKLENYKELEIKLLNLVYILFIVHTRYIILIYIDTQTSQLGFPNLKYTLRMRITRLLSNLFFFFYRLPFDCLNLKHYCHIS